MIRRPRGRTRALRVCLVRPPTLTAPRSLSYYGTVLPLGLAYVAAAVRAAGHDVRVLDGPGLALDPRTRVVSPAGPLALHGATPEELAARVGDADVVGISHGFLHEWDLVREIVARVRLASPHATIVLGGENVSGWWDRVLALGSGVHRGRGSERTLARIGKRVRLPALERSLTSAVAAGMKTHASIIVGFPGETPRDLWDTWRLCARMAGRGLHGLSVLVFSPYPGSALYRELRGRGLLREDARWRYASLLRSLGGGGSPRASSSARRGLLVQLAILAGFHALAYARRPWRLAEHAWALAVGEQRTVMDQFLATKLAQVRDAVRAARVRPRHASPEPVPRPVPNDPPLGGDPRASTSVPVRV